MWHVLAIFRIFWLFRDGGWPTNTLSQHSTTHTGEWPPAPHRTTRLKAPQVNDPLAPHGSSRHTAQVWWHPFYPTKKIYSIYSISGKVVFVKMSDLVIIHGIYLRFLENPTFCIFNPPWYKYILTCTRYTQRGRAYVSFITRASSNLSSISTYFIRSTGVRVTGVSCYK